jgi:hypothetical protein
MGRRHTVMVAATWYPPDDTTGGVLPQDCELYDISVTGALIVAPDNPQIGIGTSIPVETGSGVRFVASVRNIRRVTRMRNGSTGEPGTWSLYGVELDRPTVAALLGF